MSDDWQVVEEALGNMPHLPTAEYHAVNAALARLREREAQLEREKAEQLKITEAVAELLVEAKRERNAAEARVAELEPMLVGQQVKAARAEARVARLEEALLAADEALHWLGVNYPKALRELPRPIYQRVKQTTLAALAREEKADNE